MRSDETGRVTVELPSAVRDGIEDIQDNFESCVGLLRSCDCTQIRLRCQIVSFIVFISLAVMGQVLLDNFRHPLSCAQVARTTDNPEFLHCFDAHAFQMNSAGCWNSSSNPTQTGEGSFSACGCADFRCGVVQLCTASVKASGCQCGGCSECNECICQSGYGSSMYHVCVPFKMSPGKWADALVYISYGIAFLCLTGLLIKYLLRMCARRLINKRRKRHQESNVFRIDLGKGVDFIKNTIAKRFRHEVPSPVAEQPQPGQVPGRETQQAVQTVLKSVLNSGEVDFKKGIATALTEPAFQQAFLEFLQHRTPTAPPRSNAGWENCGAEVREREALAREDAEPPLQPSVKRRLSLDDRAEMREPKGESSGKVGAVFNAIGSIVKHLAHEANQAHKNKSEFTDIYQGSGGTSGMPRYSHGRSPSVSCSDIETGHISEGPDTRASQGRSSPLVFVTNENNCAESSPGCAGWSPPKVIPVPQESLDISVPIPARRKASSLREASPYNFEHGPHYGETPLLDTAVTLVRDTRASGLKDTVKSFGKVAGKAAIKTLEKTIERHTGENHHSIVAGIKRAAVAAPLQVQAFVQQHHLIPGPAPGLASEGQKSLSFIKGSGPPSSSNMQDGSCHDDATDHFSTPVSSSQSCSDED